MDELKSEGVENFKCFHEKNELRLAPIAVMYGENG